jgi:hypothetical protein
MTDILVDSGFKIGSYPIYFQVVIPKYASTRQISIIAVLPGDYPDTPLREYFGGEVAQVLMEISFKKIYVKNLRVYSSSRTRFETGEQPYPEEIQGTKGLGKAILCYGIQIALKQFVDFIGSPSELVVELVTGATQHYEFDELQALIEQNLNHLSRLDMTSQIIHWFPMLDPIILRNRLDQNDDYTLGKLFTKHQENHKLADYYQQTYGFERIPSYSSYHLIENDAIIMQAPISVVLEHCNPSSQTMESDEENKEDVDLTIDSGFAISSYPITFNIKILYNYNGVEVYALLPSNYPDTPLKQTFEGKVAQVIINIHAEDRLEKSAYSNYDNNIYIGHLRVLASSRTPLKNGVFPLEEEIKGTKGLGKAILCCGVYHAWSYFKLGSLSKLGVHLKTGAIDFYEQRELDVLLRRYQGLSREDLIYNLLEHHLLVDISNAYDVYNQYTTEKLRLIYLNYVENTKLAEYYQYTYGFQPVLLDLFAESVYMVAPATTIFEHCNLPLE